MRAAARLTITGVVQGVGFRPFVHRLAVAHDLSGWVRNASGQVEIHAEGEAAALDAFAAAIPAQLPPLAQIDSLALSVDTVRGDRDFRILESRQAADDRLPVPADVVTCDACAKELFDPADRRYRYAFTTCTDCGPRYTVIESLPYDRERTSLRAFPLCPRCQAEYDTPGDRRFHAESIACPECGPHLVFRPVGDASAASGLTFDASLFEQVAGDDARAVAAAAALLVAGGIVGVRGLGGFHLACDATSAHAVARLRARKRRDAKPLACMVRTVNDAAQWVHLTDTERAWLTARERPIVLLERRRLTGLHPAPAGALEGTPYAAMTLADGLAPGLDRIGLMLASTPLHHLLLEATGRPLVMTSGNLADEPLAAGTDEATQRLAGIADALLTHDREIVARIDDSVVRLAGDTPVVIRRGRGYAPLPATLPVTSPVPLLAVGAHLKNTFTFVHGARAFVSPHIGDLDSLEGLAHWHAVRARYAQLFRVTPARVVADLHDGYLSTRAADELAEVSGLGPVLRVQHHHAHIAAVAAEHGVRERVLGLAFDGTGAGTDGTVWGMEFLVADLSGFERVGHLRPAPLPGGDAAVRAPWRTLGGYASLASDASGVHDAWWQLAPVTERAVVSQQVTRRVNTPLASSAGRLFDAVASLLGICQRARYEGEAAMLLEAHAGTLRGLQLPFPLMTSGTGLLMLDPLPLLSALAARRARGLATTQLAADFHDSFIRGVLDLTRLLADRHELGIVALGGGCFQNARLLQGVRAGAEQAGLRVLTALRVPANDGGVSFGQAAVAAAQLSS